MTINLHLPTQSETLRPTITVIGVGGAGGNAVNNMIAAKLAGVDFVVANTDAQALQNAQTNRAIQLGAGITKGLGAGADPQMGAAAAEEALDEIIGHIEGSNMVFITAGMGGGTGTGAAPVVARAAKELGILTVGVITKPFQFEGAHRMRIADEGIKELQQYVDTLIIIPNQNLFRVATEKTTFADAFRMADEVLHSGVRGVTDLMIKPGLVNLDFADIRAVMREMGKAMMGTGEATGEKRAIDAAEAAISNPLLDDVSLRGAKAALINITGGSDMTLFEVDEAANRIREEIDPDANIIFGSAFNDELEGVIRVSVVATGIDAEVGQKEDAAAQNAARVARRPFSFGQAPIPAREERPKPPVIAKEKPAEPAAPAPRPQPQPAAAAPQPQPVAAEPAPVAAAPQPQEKRAEAPAPVAAQAEAGPLFVSPRESGPVQRSVEAPAAREPVAEENEEARSVPTFRFLNRIAEVGRALAPKQEASEPASRARSVEVAEKRRGEPETPEAQMDEEYYDIPAFLRRQAN